MLISSPINEKLKHARRVREGKEDGLIFIEGERLAEECLLSKLTPHACFHLTNPSPRSVAVIDSLNTLKCPIYEVSDAAFTTLSDTVNSQGIIILAERPVYKFDNIFTNNSAQLFVCLGAVQDPGNAGTIIRTTEAAGGNAIIALRGTVDVFSPKTLRSAMGSAFRLPIVDQIDFNELEKQSRSKGITIVGAAGSGEVNYTEYDWLQPTIVIFGNEGRGINEEILERCDIKLRIPLHGAVESLNVASAASAMLFEAARQRSSFKFQVSSFKTEDDSSHET